MPGAGFAQLGFQEQGVRRRDPLAGLQAFDDLDRR